MNRIPRVLPLSPIVGALSESTAANVLPPLGRLSDYFSPRRLADRTTVELVNQLPPAGALRPGPYPPHQPARSTRYPEVRKLSPTEVIAPPVGVDGGMLGQALNALPGILGGPVTSPVLEPQFPMQDMGVIPEGPTYPHVQPGEQVRQQQLTQQSGQPSQYNIRPQETQGFGDRSNAATPQQNSFLSDPAMWGLMAAGLGILANNSGNYGQASPAIGKGGLIGVQTFLGQRQQGIENQRRNELAAADAAWRQSQANYNDRSLGLQERRIDREERAEREAAQQREMRAALAVSLAGGNTDLQKIAASNPDEFLKFRLGQLKPEYKERSVKEGKTAYDEYSLDGGKTWDKIPGGGKYDLRAARGGADIKVDARDTAGIKAAIDIDKDRLKEWQSASDAASKGLLPVVRMEKALEGATTYSGAIAPYQKGLANILSGVGIPVDTDRLASSEEYEAQMAQWVRNNIKALGSGTAISNVDLAFTMNSGPAMKNSLPGKKLMLKAMRADMEWIQDAYSSMRKYWDDHNYSLTGWKPPEYKILKELDQTNRPSIDEVMSK